jgi:uncharacterized protein (TIGR04222 family)
MDPITWIAHLRGPEFLFLYSVLSVLTIGACVLWARRLDPISGMIAFPSRPTANSDPFEIAWLREGLAGVLVTALFTLRQRGAIALSNDTIARTDARHPIDHPAQRAVYDAVAAPRRLSELRTDRVLKGALDRVAAGYASKFAFAGLATSPTERRRAFTALGAGLTAILGLGLFKVVAAISTGHYNVAFLIVLALVASIALTVACWPRRLNGRGRAFVRDLKNEYGAWATSAGSAPAADVLPLYVALLGTGVLASTEFADVDRARASLVPGSSSGGSDGGGCGSSSSCSSGGGCGGGGCGGCGGG